MDALTGLPVFALPTESEKVCEVSESLSALRKYCPKLKCVITDKCCGDKTILEALGNDICIKLDLGHLVRRIGRIIPKKKMLNSDRAKFLKELRMIARSENDYGIKRTKDTAKEEDIKKNFDNLIELADTLFEGKSFLHLLKTTIIKEKKHANCLAEIPAGVKGTNANESFHSSLKRRMPIRGQVCPQVGLAQLY
jgi:hypothetical protein